MHIESTRFGRVELDGDDIIRFPSGIIGMDECRHWVLLADSRNDSLGWLQSTNQPEIALAVVSPRPFVPDYQLRVSRNEIAPLELDTLADAQVLLVVAKHSAGYTVNLKAPLVINLRRNIGRQVICNGEQPLQFQLMPERPELRKSA